MSRTVTFLTESTQEATVTPFLEILRTAKPEQPSVIGW